MEFVGLELNTLSLLNAIICSKFNLPYNGVYYSQEQLYFAFHTLNPTLFQICLENNMNYVDFARALNLKFGVMHNLISSFPVSSGVDIYFQCSSNYPASNRDFFVHVDGKTYFYEFKNYVFTKHGYTDQEFHKIINHIGLIENPDMRLIIDASYRTGSTFPEIKALKLSDGQILFKNYLKIVQEDPIIKSLHQNGQIKMNMSKYLTPEITNSIIENISTGRIKLLKR